MLVVEPYNFDTAKEDPNAFFKLSPFLSGVQNRLTYFMDACREDGDYLNRLFLFREFGAQSPADVVKTVALRLNARSEYARLRPTMDSTVAYAGGGFLRHTSGERRKRSSARRCCANRIPAIPMICSTLPRRFWRATRRSARKRAAV